MSSTDQHQQRIAIIRDFPAKLEAQLAGLTDAQLKAHTLPDEWSVQQIVHHLADSHMVSVIRLKLILTSDEPTLHSYDQDSWALLPDVEAAPVATSLDILKGLHARWVLLFEYVAANDLWQKTGLLSTGRTTTCDELLRIYSGHCNDHLEQIRRILDAG